MIGYDHILALKPYWILDYYGTWPLTMHINIIGCFLCFCCTCQTAMCANSQMIVKKISQQQMTMSLTGGQNLLINQRDYISTDWIELNRIELMNKNIKTRLHGQQILMECGNAMRYSLEDAVIRTKKKNKARQWKTE